MALAVTASQCEILNIRKLSSTGQELMDAFSRIYILAMMRETINSDSNQLPVQSWDMYLD